MIAVARYYRRRCALHDATCLFLYRNESTLFRELATHAQSSHWYVSSASPSRLTPDWAPALQHLRRPEASPRPGDDRLRAAHALHPTHGS